jgi:RNA polymerase sigma-70 factor (ECF subfamily)
LSRFENLLVEEIPSLRRYAWALSGESTAVDDLVQECLARAISRRKLWISHQGIRPWLFTILHNIFVNSVRSSSPLSEGNSIENYEDLTTSESDADAMCVLSDFEKSLNRLSLDQREALILVGMEQLSYKDAAKVAGVPVGTIMSRLSRAREQLAEYLNGEIQVANLRRVK